MFRNWRRQWRRKRALKRLAPRIESLCSELSAEWSRPVTLEISGARGRDSIFIARDGAVALAVLRVINPYLKRKPIPEGMPYTVGDGPARLDREWHCYEQCAALGVGPQPLWRTHDAIACKYIEGERLAARLDARVGEFWSLNTQVSKLLGTLHAHGLTHMDASLANTIAGPQGLCLIDFEYHAAAHITAHQARCYDHLRLVESAMKFVPEAIVTDCTKWLETVQSVETAAVLQAPLEHLAVALPRVFGHQHLLAELSRCFTGLAPVKVGRELSHP